MKKYVIKLNGKVYEIEMEEVTEETAAAAAAEAPRPAVVKDVPKAVPPVSGGTSVNAPMPGTIISVAVKEGDKVKRNQVLLILEAMKMENEIVSPAEGTVLSVNVSKGQSVNPGELLVKIG